MRPWILAETNYYQVKDCEYQVAVLPMGATEPHNLHLPYSTDTLQAEAISSRVCEAAWNDGARVVMLPAIPYGTETNQAEYRLSMNVNPSTLGMIIRDLIDSLANHGIFKLVILNSHGGNEFKPLLRELLGTTPVQLFLCDWFRGITADVQGDIFLKTPETTPEKWKRPSGWLFSTTWSAKTKTVPLRPTTELSMPHDLMPSTMAG